MSFESLKSVQLFGLKSSKILGWGESIESNLIQSLVNEQFEIQNGDLICISSKLFSIQEQRGVDLEDLSPTEEAHALAAKSQLSPNLVQLIIDNSIRVIGVSYKSILSETEYGFYSNAGIDESNAPNGLALLLPQNSDHLAEQLSLGIENQLKKAVSIMMLDTKSIAMKMGTMGTSLGLAGFEPVIDKRGAVDLYGRPYSLTQINIAESIAGAANLLMGETNEQVPYVIVRGLRLQPQKRGSRDISIPSNQCLYFGPLTSE